MDLSPVCEKKGTKSQSPSVDKKPVQGSRERIYLPGMMEPAESLQFSFGQRSQTERRKGETASCGSS